MTKMMNNSNNGATAAFGGAVTNNITNENNRKMKRAFTLVKKKTATAFEDAITKVLEDSEMRTYHKFDAETVKSYANMLDGIALDNAVKMRQDKNVGVGPTTLSAQSFADLRNLPEEFADVTCEILSKSLKIMASKDEDMKKMNLHFCGQKKYEGVAIRTLNIDEYTIKLSNMDDTKDAQILILAEINNSDLTNIENVQKILLDLTHLHRVYQEKTIDAAKKLYKVFALFYNTVLRSNSTHHKNIELVSLKGLVDGKANSIKYKVKKGRLEKGTALADYNIKKVRGSEVKIVFQDIVGEIQDAMFEAVKDFLNNSCKDIYTKCTYSKDIIKAMPTDGIDKEIVLELRDKVVIPYNQIVIEAAQKIKRYESQLKEKEGFKSEYIKSCKMLVNKIYITKDNKAYELECLTNVAKALLSDYSAAKAGLLLMEAGMLTSNPNLMTKPFNSKLGINAKSTNQCAKTLCPDFHAAFVMEYLAENKYVGSMIMGKKSDIESLKKGQTLEFLDGSCTDAELNIRLSDEDIVEGICTRTVKVIDGRVYAVQSAVELIEANIDRNYALDYINVSLFGQDALNVASELGMEELADAAPSVMFDYINKNASSVQLRKAFKVNGIIRRNAVVATINGTETVIGMFNAESTKFREMINGATSVDFKIKTTSSEDGLKSFSRITMEIDSIEEVEEIDESVLDKADKVSISSKNAFASIFGGIGAGNSKPAEKVENKTTSKDRKK